MVIIYDTYHNTENYSELVENPKPDAKEIEELVKNAELLVKSSNLGTANEVSNKQDSYSTNGISNKDSYSTNDIGNKDYYYTNFVNNQRPDSSIPLLEQDRKILDALVQNAELFAKSSGLGKVWVNTNMMRDKQDSYYTNQLKKSIPNPVLDIINKNTGERYNDFVNYDPSVNSLPMYPNFINSFNENQINNIMTDINTNLSQSLLNIGINTKHKKDEKIKDYYTIR